jgi:hypothetical protein
LYTCILANLHTCKPAYLQTCILANLHHVSPKEWGKNAYDY